MQQVNGRDESFTIGECEFCAEAASAAVLHSSKFPQRMKSFSRRLFRQFLSRRRLPKKGFVRMGLTNGLHSPTHSEGLRSSRCSPSGPDTKTFICSRCCCLLMTGSVPSRRRQKRHSHDACSYSSVSMSSLPR